MKKLKTLLAVLLCIAPLTTSIAANDELEIGKGLIALEEKRYDDAFDFFSNFLINNPKNQVGLYYHSQAALGRKDLATALSDVNKAMKASAGFLKKKEIKKDELLVQRGLVYMQMGENEQAINDFSQALVENPTSVDALVNRGKGKAQQKELEQSDNDYKQALTIDETNLGANLGLAQNMITRGDYSKATTTLSKLDILYPHNNDIIALRGDIYLLMGKYQEAFDDAIAQIAQQEDYTKSLPTVAARATQCETYALPKISRMVKSGQSPDLWLQLRARINEQLDRYDDAIADYDQLEKILGESFASICVGRANCLRRKGEFIQAENEYRRALDLEENADAYAGWAKTKLDQAKLDSAMQLVNKAITSDPTNANYYYLRGKISEAKGNTNQAMRDYEMGLNADRKHTPLLYSLGRLQQMQKKSTNNFNIIIDQEYAPQPSDNRKAFALHLNGENKSAEEWCVKTTARFPTAMNYYDAALLYADMNNAEKACQMLEKSFSMGYREYGTLNYEPELSQLRNEKTYATLMQKWAPNSLKSNNIASTKTEKDSSSTKKEMPIIPCTIDGMMLTFTTNNDTAKIFTISLMDVQMLLKYGYMQKNDVIAQRDQKSLDIMNIPVGSQVVLRTFKWANKVLRNVTATIVADPLAPILITQGMLNEIDK
ncbi:MAG: hypothetical protein KBT32_06015 [Bacteroidales bacterium]|nr:hypothetical protein [Candidatus Physcocola equi]